MFSLEKEPGKSPALAGETFRLIEEWGKAREMSTRIGAGGRKVHLAERGLVVLPGALGGGKGGRLGNASEAGGEASGRARARPLYIDGGGRRGRGA